MEHDSHRADLPGQGPFVPGFLVDPCFLAGFQAGSSCWEEGRGSLVEGYDLGQVQAQNVLGFQVSPSCYHAGFLACVPVEDHREEGYGEGPSCLHGDFLVDLLDHEMVD